jgi:sugar (pentulose or hexulose) kinase
MYLGMNFGTASANVVLVGPDGATVAGATAAVQPAGPGTDGRFEQNLEEFYAGALAAIRQIGQQADLKAVQAIGVAAQGGAFQMLDFRHKPMGGIVVARDRRGREFYQRLRRLWGDELVRLTGQDRTDCPYGQLLRLRAQRPLVLGPPNGVGYLGDVIVGRLCGRRAHDATSLSAAGLYNPRRRKVEPRLLEELELGRDRLPALLGPREAAGKVRNDVSRRTLLPAGAPVSAAVDNRYAAALTARVTAVGEALLLAGGPWGLLAVADRLGEPLHGGSVCQHLVDGLFGHVVDLEAANSAVGWAMDQLNLRGSPPEEIAAMVAAVGVGAAGLRFQLRRSDPQEDLPAGTPGRLLNATTDHKTGHGLRAIIEALAMELACRLGELAEQGVRVSRLTVIGRSPAALALPQIVADVTGLPVAHGLEGDPAATGAAILARGLLERRTSLADLARQMSPEPKVVNPGPEAGEYPRMVEKYAAGREKKAGAQGSE